MLGLGENPLTTFALNVEAEYPKRGYLLPFPVCGMTDDVLPGYVQFYLALGDGRQDAPPGEAGIRTHGGGGGGRRKGTPQLVLAWNNAQVYR